MRTNFNNRILIIDDNEAIHADFKKTLLQGSETNSELQALEDSLANVKREVSTFPEFEIDSAHQGKEGLECVQNAINKGLPYALTFVDMRMPPGWDGIETIEAIWKIDSAIQTVICTAYSDYSLEDIIKRLGHSDRLLIIKKPFDLFEIRLSALALTKKWELNRQANLKLEELQEIVEDKTKQLSLSLSLTEATLESTADGIMVIDKNKNILQYNKKMMEIWAIPQEILNHDQAQKIVDYMKKQTNHSIDIPVDIEKITTDRLFGTYKEITLKTNKVIEQYIQPQYHEKNVVGIVYNFRDITKRKRLEEELAKQATYDHLTGLPNRVLLVDRIQHAITYAHRNKNYVVVLFMDLDRFKQVNDSFGHDVGDNLLKIFANRLKNCLRESDVVVHLDSIVSTDTAARLGGDEFVTVLTTNSNDVEQISLVMQRLYNILTQPYPLADHELTVTFSTGVSIFPRDGEDPITLIKNADSAMYYAKEKRSGTFEFFEKIMSDKPLLRLELENNLRQALAKNELFLNYQPSFNIIEKKIASLEVLLRWQHPKLGLIEPTTFIPIAENSGLIIPIGNWLMRAACAQNKLWQDSGLPPIPISVNLSGIQFKQKNIVEEVKTILDETGLDPKYLELELTENILLSDSYDVSLKIEKFKEIGVMIDIDDFGTGYSSLSYINQFTIDKIKIDQSFIKKLSSNSESQVVVQAIILIAKALKMSVVAEGVETDKQLEILQNISTDMVQGFYLSRPLSVKDASNLLEGNVATHQLLMSANKKPKSNN